MSEISVTLLEIDVILSNLSSWMKPVKVKSPGRLLGKLSKSLPFSSKKCV